jgi:uncharacterized protein involved in response to NO
LSQQKRKTLSADVLFFPAAAAFSAIIIPSWIMALQGWIPIPGPYWHGHEMLFGYAFAVVSGYLITRVSSVMLGGLFLSWLAARLAAFGVMGDSLATALPGLVFAGLVIYLVAPPFLRAAKKAENRVFGPLFIAMGTCELTYQLAAAKVIPGAEPIALLIAVDLFSLLLLLMGGRIIAPAVAGHFHRSGRFLAARVQPRLERTAIVFMIGMIVLDLIPKAAPVAGVFALGAATVTAIRTWRWQLWSVLNQPYLWALGLGYTWLALGLGLKGLAQIFGDLLSLIEAFHGITIGALGTLTLVVMARTRLQRSRQGLEYFSDIGMAALLVSLAALLRLGAPLADSEYTLLLLWASATAWLFAFSLLLRRLVLIYRKGLIKAVGNE